MISFAGRRRRAEKRARFLQERLTKTATERDRYRRVLTIIAGCPTCDCGVWAREMLHDEELREEAG